MNIVFPKVRVTAQDQAGEFKYHTLGSIYGMKLMNGLPSYVLRRATNRKTKTHEAVRLKIGLDTNPNWIVGVAAEILYARGEIDEKEFDRLND